MSPLTKEARTWLAGLSTDDRGRVEVGKAKQMQGVREALQEAAADLGKRILITCSLVTGSPVVRFLVCDPLPKVPRGQGVRKAPKAKATSKVKGFLGRLFGKGTPKATPKVRKAQVKATSKAKVSKAPAKATSKVKATPKAPKVTSKAKATPKATSKAPKVSKAPKAPAKAPKATPKAKATSKAPAKAKATPKVKAQVKATPKAKAPKA